MKKDAKIAKNLTQTILTIVTRVENNQQGKSFYKMFLLRISNYPGKYGYPGLAVKSDENQSFFKTQVWFDPGTNQGSEIWLTTNSSEKKTIKSSRDVYLNGGISVQNNGLRKQRDTSYSMTQRLLKKLVEGRVVEYWQKYGMYKSSELLSIEMQEYVSPYTMRHLSNIKNWKRPVNKLSPIYKGVLAGTISAAYYKHLIFPKEEMNNGERNNYKLSKQ